MLFIMSEVVETKILSEMREAYHFAIMLDEATDCTVIEQLAVHGRYIHRDTGELKSHYLKVIDILKPEIDELNSSNTGDLHCAAHRLNLASSHAADITVFWVKYTISLTIALCEWQGYKQYKLFSTRKDSC